MPEKITEELYKKALYNAQAFSQKQVNYSCTDKKITLVSCQRKKTIIMFLFDADAPTTCDMYCFARIHPEHSGKEADIDLCTLRDKTRHPQWEGIYEGNYYICRSIDASDLARSVSGVERIVDKCINDCKTALAIELHRASIDASIATPSITEGI